MLTLHDLENKIATSASRQFEYNAVKSAFENACAKGILDLENEDYDHNIAKLTFNDQPLETYTVKNFRQTLAPESQPCATTFWKKKSNIDIDHNYWSAAFTATKRNTSQNTAMENPT